MPGRRKGASSYARFVGSFIKSHRGRGATKNLMKMAARAWRGRR